MGIETVILETTMRTRERGDFGGVIRFAGGDIPCSIGALMDSSRLTTGGFSPDKDMLIVIRKSAFPDAPPSSPFQTGHGIELRQNAGTQYSLQVQSVQDGIAFWQLTCSDRNQGA